VSALTALTSAASFVVSDAVGTTPVLPPDIEPDLLLFRTSGTTGEPRLIAHDCSTLLASLYLTSSVQAEMLGMTMPAAVPIGSHLLGWAASLVDTPAMGLVFATCMPPWTIAGWTVLQRALLTGETLVLLDRQTPTELLSAVGRRRVTSASVTPMLAARLARHDEAGPQNPIVLGIGGAKASADAAAGIERRFGWTTFVGYGATELGGPALMSRVNDPPDARWSSIGRPLPSVQIRIDGRECPPGSTTEGRLSVRSPAMMVGVVEGGHLAMHASEWYETGDVVALTEEGCVRFVARASAIIQRGAQRIDPTEIERLLEADPTVVSAAVFAAPSPQLRDEDIIVAVLEVENPSDLTVIDRVRRMCRLASTDNRLYAFE
jgi:acyl-coenzyme A synthetase/AMP-(fatty) acid ligase